MPLSLAIPDADYVAQGARIAPDAEAVFAEILRRYVRTLPGGQTGWLAGARDAEIGKALTLLHQQPAERWTVA